MKGKIPRLSRSGIEYLDYTWGIYSGCTNWANSVCGGGGKDFNCWAMTTTQRFPAHYPNGFDPTWYPEAMMSPLRISKPSIISVGWMGDIFLDENDPNMMINVPLVPGLSEARPVRDWLFKVIRQCPQHRFLFLTKCPWNLPKWSPYPENCWLGVTATDEMMFAAAYYHLARIEARLKYISIEPLLHWDERVTAPMIYQAVQAGVKWLIIGAATRPYRPPKVESVEQLVYECLVARTPVFLKDNLVKALPKTIPFYVPPAIGELKDGDEIKMVYRQEIPE